MGFNAIQIFIFYWQFNNSLRETICLRGNITNTLELSSIISTIQLFLIQDNNQRTLLTTMYICMYLYWSVYRGRQNTFHTAVPVRRYTSICAAAKNLRITRTTTTTTAIATATKQHNGGAARRRRRAVGGGKDDVDD